MNRINIYDVEYFFQGLLFLQEYLIWPLFLTKTCFVKKWYDAVKSKTRF